MKKIYVYIGTSYKSPRQKEGAYGYILEHPTPKGPATLTQIKYVKDMTFHKAELTALVEALKRLRYSCDLEIFTDSVYIVSTWEQEFPKRWAEQNWKNSRGEDIANKEEWQEMLRLLIGNVAFHLNEEHSYKQWLKRELEKKGEEDV